MMPAWARMVCFVAALLIAVLAFASGRDWEWDYTGEGSTWGGGRPGESRALRPAHERWHVMGSCGAGEGRNEVRGTFRNVTKVRLSCVDGRGKLRTVWVVNGGSRYQIGLNRDFRAGDVFEKDLGGQNITSVTISDTGSCIFLVEVYEDERFRAQPRKPSLPE